MRFLTLTQFNDLKIQLTRHPAQELYLIEKAGVYGYSLETIDYVNLSETYEDYLSIYENFVERRKERQKPKVKTLERFCVVCAEEIPNARKNSKFCKVHRNPNYYNLSYARHHSFLKKII